jgi:hypothetical protein
MTVQNSWILILVGMNLWGLVLFQATHLALRELVLFQATHLAL